MLARLSNEQTPSSFSFLFIFFSTTISHIYRRECFCKAARRKSAEIKFLSFVSSAERTTFATRSGEKGVANLFVCSLCTDDRAIVFGPFREPWKETWMVGKVSKRIYTLCRRFASGSKSYFLFARSFLTNFTVGVCTQSSAHESAILPCKSGARSAR